jgi:anthranilate synthase component 1
MPVTTLPPASEFAAHAARARFVPVYRQLTADTLTPVTAYQRLSTGDWAFLFESVIGGERIGRFSFVGSQPFLSLSATGNRVTISERDKICQEFESADPLKDLDQLLAAYTSVAIPGLPRFTGGAVGFAGYDVIRYTENLPNCPPDDRQLPDMCFALYDKMVVFDHIRKVAMVIALADVSSGDLVSARELAEQKLDHMCQRLADASGDVQLSDVDLTVEPAPVLNSNFTQDEFHAAIERRVSGCDRSASQICQPGKASGRLSISANGKSQPVYVSAANAGSGPRRQFA